MVYKLDKNIDCKKTALAFSALSALFGFLSSLSFPVGFLFIPLVSAFYGGVVVTEMQSRFRFAYILPAVLILFDVLLCGFYSFNSLFAVAIGAVMGLALTKGKSKAESSVYLTLLFLLSITVSALLYLFYLTDSFSFSTVVDYLKNEYSEVREIFIRTLKEFSLESEAGYNVESITEETAAYIFDSFSSLTFAFCVALAFLLSGIALKVYSLILMKRADDPEYFVKWRFLPSSLFAYAYVVLVVLNFLAGNSADIFALTVANLCYILMPAFVYLGLQFVYALFRQRHSAFMAVLIIAIAALLFASVSLEVFSYAGVIFTIVFHKTSKKFSV